MSAKDIGKTQNSTVKIVESKKYSIICCSIATHVQYKVIFKKMAQNLFNRMELNPMLTKKPKEQNI